MKRFFVIPALICSLFFFGCSQEGSGDLDYLTEQPIAATLKISNNSSYDIWDVQWSGKNFNTTNLGNPLSFPSEFLLSAGKLPKGSYATYTDLLSPGEDMSSYVYFKFAPGGFLNQGEGQVTINGPVYSVRTKELVILEPEGSVVFTIIDNTIVINTTDNNSENTLGSTGE
jgi:hypothetical protein